jgi:hypothetical protein
MSYIEELKYIYKGTNRRVIEDKDYIDLRVLVLLVV